jgi:hypothetical protein
MRSAASRFFPLLLLAFVALTGCRTYGGYETEEATAAEMKEAVTLFADNLERAQGNLQALNNAASGNPDLQRFKEPYQAMVNVHELALERQREILEEFGPGDSYRGLHRAYGAIVTQQRMIRHRYFNLHEQIAYAVRGESPEAYNMPTRTEYYVSPIWYQHEENERNQMTMQQALRGGLPALAGR